MESRFWSKPAGRVARHSRFLPLPKPAQHLEPGWGIEVDEKAAAKYPFRDAAGARSGLNGGWGDLRLADGTVIKQ